MTPAEAHNRLWIAHIVVRAARNRTPLHLKYTDARWQTVEEPDMHTLTLPLTLLSISLLVACAPAATPSPAAQPTNITVTATATATTVAVATATATATTTPDPLVAYRSQIEQHYNAWRRDFDELSSLSAMTTAGAGVVFNSEWQRRTAAVITAIAATNTAVRALEAPPAARPAQALFIQAADHFDRAIGLYATAINNLDAAGVAAVTPELEAGLGALQAALRAVP